MPKISVLVPVYNVEKYLGRCLDSLRKQTYPDFEVICINDGATDKSPAILDQYAREDSRIKVFSYENAGISAARNRALQHASGEYLLFIDSDDYMAEDSLEKLIRPVLETGADLVMCGFSMDFSIFRFYRKVAGRKTWNNLSALHALVDNRGISNYPWGKLYAKKCFQGITFPENQKGFEDTYTIFKAIANAEKIVTIPDRLYHYVQRSGSLTNQMSLDTVMHMRTAYHYQQAYLKKLFPEENFDFSLQFYNTDMVIIYTLLLFCRRSADVSYQRDTFSFSSLPFLYKPAYYAWLSLACMKFHWSVSEAGKCL